MWQKAWKGLEKGCSLSCLHYYHHIICYIACSRFKSPLFTDLRSNILHQGNIQEQQVALQDKWSNIASSPPPPPPPPPQKFLTPPPPCQRGAGDWHSPSDIKNSSIYWGTFINYGVGLGSISVRNILLLKNWCHLKTVMWKSNKPPPPKKNYFVESSVPLQNVIGLSNTLK